MFLNTQDAAAYCNLSPSTLEKGRLSGTGPRYIKVGRRVLYDTRDLDAWFDACKRDSTSAS
jgi:hypothetical protein